MTAMNNPQLRVRSARFALTSATEMRVSRSSFELGHSFLPCFTGHIGESEQRNGCADSSHQAAGLEQQSDQSTSEIHTTACFVDNPCLRANSGKQDGRDFNDMERGRRPISFRSCVEDSERTDQKSAQVVSAVRAVGRCEDDARGDQAEKGQGQSKVEQTRVQVVQLKDEITAELKTSHQGFTNAETEEMSVLTKTIEEMSVLTKTTEDKTVRQMSLAVDVEEMESERSEAESTLFGRWIGGLLVGSWLCRPGVRV